MFDEDMSICAQKGVTHCDFCKIVDIISDTIPFCKLRKSGLDKLSARRIENWREHFILISGATTDWQAATSRAS